MHERKESLRKTKKKLLMLSVMYMFRSLVQSRRCVVRLFELVQRLVVVV